MSTEVRKLYGPPGTGKTRALSDLAVKAAQAFGPERIAAVTFTRTAAAELRERITGALGLLPPAAGRERARFMAQTLPWVGTIHSIALRLAGPSHVMGARDLSRFVRDMGGQPSEQYAEPEDAEGYQWAEPGRDEVEASLAVHAMARQRMIDFAQAYQEAQWGYDGPPLGMPQMERLARKYEDFKRDLRKIDFEDMLELGMQQTLPVSCILADEVQDNSPLLWAVLDRWSEDRLVALAGDPYQALYIWSGAEPGLFIGHAGKLHSLGDSHRLTPKAAQAAMAALRNGGYTDGEWLGTWGGVGSGLQRDGSEFWLARTGRLLAPVRRALEDDGTPYANIRGGGPLQTKEADAFRVLHRLRTRGNADAAGLAHLAATNQFISASVAKRLKDAARMEPREWLDVPTAEAQLGVGLDGLSEGFERGRYFERVLAKHGPTALREPPKVQVGTIHSAKGREADTVHLIDNWGVLPARAAEEPQGRRAEACVAYVALTRHRARFAFEDGSSVRGGPFPF